MTPQGFLSILRQLHDFENIHEPPDFQAGNFLANVKRIQNNWNHAGMQRALPVHLPVVADVHARFRNHPQHLGRHEENPRIRFFNADFR